MGFNKLLAYLPKGERNSLAVHKLTLWKLVCSNIYIMGLVILSIIGKGHTEN